MAKHQRKGKFGVSKGWGRSMADSWSRRREELWNLLGDTYDYDKDIKGKNEEVKWKQVVRLQTFRESGK